MHYLHKSVFQSHGYLSSTNCYVDNRWVLKVSGFALHAFRKDDSSEDVSNDVCNFVYAILKHDVINSYFLSIFLY